MMSNPWDIDDPFAFRCEECGEVNCLGHSTRRKTNPIAVVVAIVVSIALVAGSIGFFFGAMGNQNSSVESPSSSPASVDTSTTIESSAVPVQISADEQLMLDSVNAERAKESLDPLTWCPALARSATAHSVDMATNNYFEHESLDGREISDRAKAQGYNYRTVGENIAVGQRDVAEVMDGWMNSPGHRENILRPQFTHLGSGVATGDYKGFESIYWTQNFGAGGNCN